MEIRSIDVIVHPYYYQMATPDMPLHPRQEELIKLWEQRFEQIQRQKDSILIYFSYIPHTTLNKCLEHTSDIDDKITLKDIHTIKRLQNALGNRFIVFSHMLWPENKIILDSINLRGFTYNPSELKLNIYGEIYEVCVIAWGNHLATIMGVPTSNVLGMKDLSLTSEDCEVITKWRYRRPFANN